MDEARRGRTHPHRVSISGGYQVQYFAAKHGITHQEARELLSRIGNIELFSTPEPKRSETPVADKASARAVAMSQ